MPHSGVPCDALYFDDSARETGAGRQICHQFALQFVEHAFKRTDQDHIGHLKKLIHECKHLQSTFLESPVVGLTLFRCIQTGRQDLISCLLSEGVDVNRLFRGRGMLHEAVKVSNTDMLSFILSLPGVEKDLFDVDFKTPLMEAAKGRPQCLKILLEAGCDLTLKDASGRTALHQAFCEQRAHKQDVLSCLDLLLLHGADINSPGAKGKTCLQKAVELGNRWLLKWLLSHNCQLYPLTQSRSNVPLLIAFHRADRVMVEVLIACGCEFRNHKWMLECSKPFKLLYKSLQDAFCKVDSLQCLSRKVIRNSLSSRIKSECSLLGLPVSLQQFLLCRDELQNLDQNEWDEISK